MAAVALLINGVDAATYGLTVAEAPGWLDAPPRQTPSAPIIGRGGAKQLADPQEGPRRLTLRGTVLGKGRLRLSEQFDYAPYSTLGASILTGAITTPGGTLTGDQLREDTSTGQHWFGQTIESGPTGKRVTWPVLVKAAERTKAIITISDNVAGGASIGVDLTNGSTFASGIGAGSWTGITNSVVDYGDGWYLVTMSAIRGAGTESFGQVIMWTTSLSYAGTAGWGLYIASAVTDPATIARVRIDAAKLALLAKPLALTFADHPGRRVYATLEGFTAPTLQGSFVQEALAIEATLTAYDPLSYDNALTTVGADSGGNAYNLASGTGPTRPIITLTGAAVNPVLTLRTNAGVVIATLALTVTTIHTDVIIVDCDLKTIKLNGVNRLDLITSGDFFIMDPIDSRFQAPLPYITVAPVPDANTSVSYRKSWR